MIQFIMGLIPNIGAIMEAAGLMMGALAAFLMALGGIFLLIPGEQPEKAIFAAAQFVEKFSKKKPE